MATLILCVKPLFEVADRRTKEPTDDALLGKVAGHSPRFVGSP
jgi:hypothetical protein